MYVCMYVCEVSDADTIDCASLKNIHTWLSECTSPTCKLSEHLKKFSFDLGF